MSILRPVFILLATVTASMAAPEHPFLVFSASDIPALQARTNAAPFLATMFATVQARASAPADSFTNYPNEWAEHLEALAFVATIKNDSALQQQAIDQMLSDLRCHNPADIYTPKADFHGLAKPTRAFALAWDWLAPHMTAAQRTEALPALENWCIASYRHSDKQWWREASYNCGSVPVAGYGLLALSIRNDTTNAEIANCHREAFRRLAQSFFPRSWRPSGICFEGPNYAIVGLKYPVLFACANARAGGDDLLADTGAMRAMSYLMHQWLPWGECASIGDNTDYGKRTFASEYLLGLARSRDTEGLWTWLKYSRAKHMDEIITYLWYPLDLTPADPAQTHLPTSKYFEVTPNLAGYVFCRSAWSDTNAAFFAFTTRYDKCNHQHYDMDSFLFGGFGTLFATHQMLFPYSSDRHGVDYEHNLVIVNNGGWPTANRTPSCYDDNSTEGMLVGIALSGFADYMRGDAKWSYRDNAVWISAPAIRAERSCLFVKQTSTPYLFVFDDLQQTAKPSKYEWLWHAPRLPTSGTGTPADPLIISAAHSSCAIQFVVPEKPVFTNEIAMREEDDGALKPSSLMRLRVAQTAVRVRYAALATLQTNLAQRPRVTTLPVNGPTPSANGATVSLSDGTQDFITWQSEEEHRNCGIPLTAGHLRTDALVALVRLQNGKITGFVLGEGTYLQWDDTTLVRAAASVSVSAGMDDRQITGRRRGLENLPPETPNVAQIVALPFTPPVK